ncbi:MAG: hypothetical protein AAGE94_14155 [Acidobacteriota bacterium]
MASGSAVRGLLVKELRLLAPALGMLVLLLAFFLILAWRANASNDSAEVIPFQMGFSGALFAAALFGCLFWGGETLAGTRSFVLGLPVSRGRLVAAKAVAAGLSLVVMALLTRGLVALLPTLTPEPGSIAEVAGGALAVALIWAWFARLSMVFREPLTVLGVGMLGALLVPVVGFHMAVAAGRAPADVWRWIVPGEWPAAVLAGIGFTGLSILLWRAVDRLEDRPLGSSIDTPWSRRSGAFGGPSLPGLEWRQKVGMAAVLLMSPLIWGPLRTPLWAPVAGAVVGALLFTAAERDGVGFFLHHLPVTRRRLVAQRLVVAVLFGAVLIAELYLLRWSEGPDLGLGAFLRISGSSYLAAVVLGVLLSPWISGGLGALLAFSTLGALIVARARLAPHGSFDLPVLTALSALAWWSAVHSRALEPRPGRIARALALVMPCWGLLLFALWW